MRSRLWEWVACGHDDRATRWFLLRMAVTLVAIGCCLAALVMSAPASHAATRPPPCTQNYDVHWGPDPATYSEADWETVGCKSKLQERSACAGANGQTFLVLSGIVEGLEIEAKADCGGAPLLACYVRFFDPPNYTPQPWIKKCGLRRET